MGVIGLIVFVALQGLAVVLAYQAFYQPLPAPVRWLMAGVLALTAAVWRLIASSAFGPVAQSQTLA